MCVYKIIDCLATGKYSAQCVRVVYLRLRRFAVDDKMYLPNNK